VTTELAAPYTAYYQQRDPEHVYPVEFVVRAFLGAYPRLDRGGPYAGDRVLDLGFGDGRNMPLLANLGLRVHGVELTDEICSRARQRLARNGIAADLRVGRNAAIPFDTAWFDHVLACHSCYYVDRGTQFADNAREIARVTRPGGRFVFSAPMSTSYIMRGARDLGEGHMEIAADPYGIRNGAIMRKFDHEQDIVRAIAPWFVEASIGSCRNDFWGVEEHVWIVVCRRSEDTL
jgi:SAM-dependent methyltransferase